MEAVYSSETFVPTARLQDAISKRDHNMIISCILFLNRHLYKPMLQPICILGRASSCLFLGRDKHICFHITYLLHVFQVHPRSRRCFDLYCRKFVFFLFFQLLFYSNDLSNSSVLNYLTFC